MVNISFVDGPLTSPVLQELAACGGPIEVSAAESVDSVSRQMLASELDVGEMSLATFVKARELGHPLVALPIFTGMRLLDACFGCRPSDSVASLADLAGRRVGVPQYWMTSSIWHRAVLERFHDVTSGDVRWITVRPERFDGLTMTGVEHRPGGDLAQLLSDSVIDAILFPRPVADFFDPAIATCPIEDGVAAQVNFFSETGVLPVMHLVVMRADLVREMPELAGRLHDRFTTTRTMIFDGQLPMEASHLPIHGSDTAHVISTLGDALWPIDFAGIEPALRWFLDAAVAQGLLAEAPPIESLFATTRAGNWRSDTVAGGSRERNELGGRI